MKKLLLSTSAALLIFTMAGCSDATTSVENSSDTLISVGNKSITKGDVYGGLVAQSNITPITTALNEAIAARAVKTTKAIKGEAEEALAALVAANTDMKAYLKKNGYKNEKALMETLIAQAKTAKITNQYVDEEYKELANRLEVRQLQIIAVTDTGKIEEAEKAAKKGDDMVALASSHGDVTTYTGAAAVYTKKSGLPSAVWNTVLKTKDGKVAKKAIYDEPTSTYYIVKVVSSKTDKLKKEAMPIITALSATNDEGLTIADEAFKFYLNKYNYSVHDAKVYSAMLAESAKYER